GEVDRWPGLDLHLLSCLGIPSPPLPFLPNHECPEPRDLDLLSVAELALDGVEDDLDQPRGLPVGNASVALVHDPGDVGLGHGRRRLRSSAYLKNESVQVLRDKS